jgi:hypothetical protein
MHFIHTLGAILMDKTTRKKWKSNFQDLRSIINTWDLIPGAPEDEFDSIIHGVLSRLYRGADKIELVNYLLDELNGVYGIYSSDYYESNMAKKEVERFVEEINFWWDKKNST